MTRKEFFNAASRFDWYYEMSDDHRVWTAGQRRYSELLSETRDDPVKKAMWDAWAQHMYSGPTWKTERTPRPKLSDFINEEGDNA